MKILCFGHTHLYVCTVGMTITGKQSTAVYGPLVRFVKLWVAHAPGMLGTFSPPPWVSDPDMHQGTCVPHVPWCMPVSLTSGFLWNRWQGKPSQHSRRIRNPRFYISGKRPMDAFTSEHAQKVAHTPLSHQHSSFLMIRLLHRKHPGHCVALYGNEYISRAWNSGLYICDMVFTYCQCFILVASTNIFDDLIRYINAWKSMNRWLIEKLEI